MKVLSLNLGLEEDYLQNAFGGENIGACLRVNFYPKCPQPDLTLGLSSHSDPGGMTLLLPDDHVTGLQVRKDNHWITVKPAPHAFIVNIGDQIQVFSFFPFLLFCLCGFIILRENRCLVGNIHEPCIYNQSTWRGHVLGGVLLLPSTHSTIGQIFM